MKTALGDYFLVALVFSAIWFVIAFALALPEDVDGEE